VLGPEAMIEHLPNRPAALPWREIDLGLGQDAHEPERLRARGREVAQTHVSRAAPSNVGAFACSTQGCFRNRS